MDERVYFRQVVSLQALDGGAARFSLDHRVHDYSRWRGQLRPLTPAASQARCRMCESCVLQLPVQVLFDHPLALFASVSGYNAATLHSQAPVSSKAIEIDPWKIPSAISESSLGSFKLCVWLAALTPRRFPYLIVEGATFDGCSHTWLSLSSMFLSWQVHIRLRFITYVDVGIKSLPCLLRSARSPKEHRESFGGHEAGLSCHRSRKPRSSALDSVVDSSRLSHDCTVNAAKAAALLDAGHLLMIGYWLCVLCLGVRAALVRAPKQEDSQTSTSARVKGLAARCAARSRARLLSTRQAVGGETRLCPLCAVLNFFSNVQVYFFLA
eukprot:5431857-Pleurochrysis_carterae.AAC.2